MNQQEHPSAVCVKPTDQPWPRLSDLAAQLLKSDRLGFSRGRIRGMREATPSACSLSLGASQTCRNSRLPSTATTGVEATVETTCECTIGGIDRVAHIHHRTRESSSYTGNACRGHSIQYLFEFARPPWHGLPSLSMRFRSERDISAFAVRSATGAHQNVTVGRAPPVI